MKDKSSKFKHNKSTEKLQVDTGTKEKKKKKGRKRLATAAKTIMRLTPRTPRKSSHQNESPSSLPSQGAKEKDDGQYSKMVSSNDSTEFDSATEKKVVGKISSSQKESDTAAAAAAAAAPPAPSTTVSSKQITEAPTKIAVAPQAVVDEKKESDTAAAVAAPPAPSTTVSSKQITEASAKIAVVPAAPVDEQSVENEKKEDPLKESRSVVEEKAENRHAVQTVKSDETDLGISPVSSKETSISLRRSTSDGEVLSKDEDDDEENDQPQSLHLDDDESVATYATCMTATTVTDDKKDISSSTSPPPKTSRGRGNVKVVIRVRPMLPNTAESNAPLCVDVLPPKTPSTTQQALQIKGSQGVKTFTFDQILSQEVNQSHVYQSCVLPLIDSCLKDGYNATVLAYGQTGSGKTYTMMGEGDLEKNEQGESNATSMEGEDEKKEENEVWRAWGVIPRALRDIFIRLEEEKKQSVGGNDKNGGESFKYEVNLQSVELYGEEIRDLFPTVSSKSSFSPTTTTTPALKIRDRSSVGGDSDPEVIGATNIPVSCYDEAMRHIKRGMSHRVVASTNMNAVSSRSHAITTVKITQWRLQKINQEPGVAGSDQEQFEVRHSKIHLVDLAGSECLKRTRSEGERMKEGIHINKGLTVLGRVISALGKQSADKNVLVPYRDSKLTHLLRGSLGGNHKTLMIACISPSALNQEESLRCLRYAGRAKYIKNKVEANVTLEGDGVNKKEMMRLRLRLKEMENEISTQKNQMKVMTTEIQQLKEENESIVADNHSQVLIPEDDSGDSCEDRQDGVSKIREVHDDDLSSIGDPFVSEQFLAMKKELEILREERDTYRRLAEQSIPESDEALPPTEPSTPVRTKIDLGKTEETLDDQLSPLPPVSPRSRYHGSSRQPVPNEVNAISVPESDYVENSSFTQVTHQHPCVLNNAPCAGLRSFNTIVNRWFGQRRNFGDDDLSVTSVRSSRTTASARSNASDASRRSLQHGFLGYSSRF